MPAIEFPKTAPAAYRIEVDITDPIEVGKIYDQLYTISYMPEELSNEEAVMVIVEGMKAALDKLDLVFFDYGRGSEDPLGYCHIIYYNIGPTVHKHSDFETEFRYEVAKREPGGAISLGYAWYVAEWVPAKFPWWLLGIGVAIASIAIGSAVKKKRK